MYKQALLWRGISGVGQTDTHSVPYFSPVGAQRNFVSYLLVISSGGDGGLPVAWLCPPYDSAPFSVPHAKVESPSPHTWARHLTWWRGDGELKMDMCWYSVMSILPHYSPHLAWPGSAPWPALPRLWCSMTSHSSAQSQTSNWEARL